MKSKLCLYTACCVLSTTLSAQWLETTFAVPDSLSGGLLNPQALLYCPFNGAVYVGGTNKDCIIVLDGSTGRKIARVEAGDDIKAFSLNQATNEIYCADNNATLTVIDGETNLVKDTIHLPGAALDVCYNWLEDKIYCATWYSDKLTVIDGATHQVLTSLSIPAGEEASLCFYPPGNKVYCACSDDGTVVIDCTTDSIIANLATGEFSHRLCYDSVGNKLYCASLNTGTLAVIDPVNDTVTGIVSITGNPFALSYNPATRKLYVTSSGYKTVSIIDTGSDTVITTLWFSRHAGPICLDHVNNRVYCGCLGVFEDDNIAVIDGESNVVVKYIEAGDTPEALCFTSAGGRVFCANRYSHDIYVMNAASVTLADIAVPNGGPQALCWSSASNKVYCANQYTDNVTVIDGATNAVLKSIPVGDQPGSLCYNSVNDRIYCGIRGPKRITTINCPNDSIIAVKYTSGEPRDMCYSVENNRVYCALYDYTQGRVAVLDGETNQLVAEVPTGPKTNVVCCNPVSNKVYAINPGDNTVSVIDCSTNTVMVTMPVGSEPCALCCNPRNNKVYCANRSGSVTVIDGAQNRVITTLPASGWATGLCYNTTDNTVYCSNYYVDARHGIYRGVVSIYDGGADTVIRHLQLANIMSYPCSLYYNSQNNKAYCTDTDRDLVYVIYANYDFGMLSVPGNPVGFAWNSTQNRTYVNCLGTSQVAVLRDTLVQGVEDAGRAAGLRQNPLPSIVRGCLLLPSAPLSTHYSLLTSDGRKVADLAPGANDVSRLAPGVYFVREQSAFSSQHSGPPAVRKVVVAR